MLSSLLRSNRRAFQRDTHVTHPFSFEIVRMTSSVVLNLHESYLVLPIQPAAEVLLADPTVTGGMPVAQADSERRIKGEEWKGVSITQNIRTRRN